MLHSLSIQDYRSLLDLHLKLAPLTIIQGANGVGKSNLYKALQLFGSLAQGNFPEVIAREGGTLSCFHAAPPPGPKRPKTISLALRSSDFTWDVTFGLVPTSLSDPTVFRTDPDVKRETLTTEDNNHSRKTWTREIPHTESMLSYIRDSQNYPALTLARDRILSWRFYDSFRTDPDSPLRKPSPCFWSPILHPDGSNLAAALQTIKESSFPYRLDEAVALAFPDCQLGVVGGHGECELALEWQLPELKRPLQAHELSDGTLRFLALAAALLAPKPPSLLILNEPENSLNASVFPALIQLIKWARESSQVFIITHSHELTELLNGEENTIHHELALQNGATRLMQDVGPKRVWNFE